MISAFVAKATTSKAEYIRARAQDDYYYTKLRRSGCIYNTASNKKPGWESSE